MIALKRCGAASTTTLIMSMLASICLGITGQFCSLNQPAEPFGPLRLKDLPVDSVKRFSFGKSQPVYQKGFLFSPYESNRVWMVPRQGEAFELDLDNGSVTPFTQKFGDAFFRETIQMESLVPDPYAPGTCWFVNQQKEIFSYNFKTKAGKHLPGQRPLPQLPNCVAFTAKALWFGTSIGLISVDRKSGDIHEVDDLPKDNITSLAVNEKQQLIVNQLYTYSPETNFWSVNQQAFPVVGKPLVTENTQFYPNFGGDYRVLYGGNENWIYNNAYWIKKSGATTEVYYPPIQLDIQDFQCDSENLYVSDTSRFVIISRKYLESRCQAPADFLEKISRLRILIDSLRLYTPDPYSLRMEKIARMKRELGNEADPYIASQLYYFSHFVIIPVDEPGFRAFLKTPGLDSGTIHSAYWRLLSQWVQNGNWSGAIKILAEWEGFSGKNYSQQELRFNPDSLQAAVAQLNKIDQSDLPPAEKLWQKGLCVLGVCTSNDIFAGEACYHVSLADSVFSRIVQLYPHDKRAADADYEIIVNSFCYEGSDGRNSPEEVEMWEKYLKKYPDARLKAEIFCRMAWALGSEKADLEKAISLLEQAKRLDRELFNESASNNYTWEYENIQKRYMWYRLDFQARLKKKVIKAGEPVEVVFSIKNTSDQDATFEAWTSLQIPNFSVKITRDGSAGASIQPVRYVESSTTAFPDARLGYGEKSLDAHSTLTETWDITQIAHQYNSAVLGKFVFDQPGVYLITPYWRIDLEEKSADALRLEVR